MGEQLPFPNEVFDFIHTKDLLVHINDKEAFFREIYRVLKVGGIVLVSSAPHSGIMPGYYFTRGSKVLENIKRAGFSNTLFGAWEPEKEEIVDDWYTSKKYPVAEKRFVFKAVK